MIVHHSLQQTIFSRCSVRFVLFVEEPPHHQFCSSRGCQMQFRALPPTRARKAYATLLATIFSCRQRCPDDRLTHVCRFFQGYLCVSRNPRKPIRELECKVETAGFTVPLNRSSHTSVWSNSQLPDLRQPSKSEFRLSRHRDRHVPFRQEKAFAAQPQLRHLVHQ